MLRSSEHRKPAIRVPSTHFDIYVVLHFDIYVVLQCVLGGQRPRLTTASARVAWQS
jgi:hypothetical protein